VGGREGERERERERERDMAALIVTFHNFANAPKNVTIIVNFKKYDMKRNMYHDIDTQIGKILLITFNICIGSVLSAQKVFWGTLVFITNSKI
jgi:hypothetical protein